MRKKQEVSNYTCHTLRKFYFCKFVVFSILLRTWTVHLEFSFIIYSALSTPPFSFAVRFVVFFERLAKTLHFLKMIHGGYSRSYSNLFIIYVVACYACKYIPSQNNIKTVVIVQNIDSNTNAESTFQTSR